MGVRIVVDATSDMTPQVAVKVKTVPMTITFWETEYAGSVVGTCVGPGAIAVAFFAQK